LIAHGDLGDQLASERSFTDAEKTLRVNFTSVVSLLIPIANHLEQAKSGRLGVITSVAGDRGRPRNYTYGAAKGALNIYLQGLRTRLYASGVRVTTLKLGPVDTPMTREHEKHALFGKPKSVARSILRIGRGRPRGVRAQLLASHDADREGHAGMAISALAVPVGALRTAAPQASPLLVSSG